MGKNIMDTYFYTITKNGAKIYLKSEVPTKKAVAIGFDVNIKAVQRGVPIDIDFVPRLSKPMTPVTSKSQ